MTFVSNPFGRPTTYPFAAMDVGETVKLDVPTAADVKRLSLQDRPRHAHHDGDAR